MLYFSKFRMVIFNILRRLLTLWVKVTIHNNFKNSAQKISKKRICYVLRDESLSDLLTLKTACIKEGLPLPNKNYMTPYKKNNNTMPTFIYLRHRVGFTDKRRRTNLSLLEMVLTYVNKTTDNNVLLIPVSIFWGRAPNKEQSPFKLLLDWNFSLGGRFKKILVTLLHGRSTLLYFSPALSLRQLVDETPDLARTVRKVSRLLRIHFRQQRASIIGPDLSHRRTLVTSLINSNAIQHNIKTEAQRKHISKSKAEQKAYYYANEIVSDFSFPTIRFFDIFLTWFWNKLYSGVQVRNTEYLTKIAKTNTLIYTPCHRSHIDYLLLSYVLYYAGLTPPHIAAGINLNMPFIGRLLRKSGAFYIRRQFKNNILYSHVFYEYVRLLMRRGFPIEYFIEGGRSRTGRTLTPKTGMLAISVRSYLKDKRRPVCFVPVYIGYEKILEGSTYTNELKGKKKKKESIKDLIKTVFALKNHFGQAWVNFGEPIYLESHLTRTYPQLKKDATIFEKAPHLFNQCINQLSIKIACHINAAAVVNPVNLIAIILLSTPRYALGERELILHLDAFVALLQNAPSRKSCVLSQLDSQKMIHYVEKLSLLHRTTDSLGDILLLKNKTAVQMTYYKNNILHLLTIPSLISCLLINNVRISAKEIIRIAFILYPYLQSELFLQLQPKKLLKEVKAWLVIMENEKLIIKNNGHEYCRAETNSNGGVIITVLARLITQTLERFYMTVSLLVNHGNQAIRQNTLEKQGVHLAQRLSIIHGLHSPEFFDQTLFKKFINQLCVQEVITSNAEGMLSFDNRIKQVIQEASKVLNNEIRYSILQATLNKVKYDC